MSDKKTCGCPIEMPYGCPIHNPLPSAASPSYTVLIAEISALRAEVARLEKERDELLMRVEDLHRLSQGLNQSALKLMDGGEDWKSRAEKAEAFAEKCRALYGPRSTLETAIKYQAKRDARLAALEKVAEAARRMHDLFDLMGGLKSSSPMCLEWARDLYAALAALDQLDGKEKP